MLAVFRTVLAILIILSLNGTAPTFAGSIVGRVLDAGTGRPVAGATVTVVCGDGPCPHIGCSTDKSGHYALSGLAPGLHTLTFSHVGFTTQTITSTGGPQIAVDTVNVELVAAIININAISVSASRRPEKVVEAPASIAVIDSSQVQARTILSTADHLKSVPAVDAVATGMNSSSVVVRGFNTVFSSTLLSMIDYRLTHVPSLRVNAYQFLPIVNEDIERVEVVLGPGSALYGPNCADGVMHIITKSPFVSTGTRISLSGGERELLMGSFRHASRFSDKVGFRLSGQYYQAEDWQVDDPAEPDSIWLFRQTPDGNDYDPAPTDNSRDFGIEKLSLDGRLDVSLGDHTVLISNAGLARSSNIEMTDLGAAQARDWTYGYLQSRLLYKDLFVQGFVNMSDAGETYLRRSGARIVDNSKYYTAQVQHALRFGERHSLTYGFDAFFTRPSTDGTLNGRNERRDNYTEYGVYLQSESQLRSWLTFVAAGRLDDHSLVDKPIASPRAALTVHPSPSHNFRLTYNQAYGTPSSPNFFLDILSATVPTDDPALEALIGPTIMNIRGMGTVDGFSFRYSPDGRPEMVSLYGGTLDDMGLIASANSYLPADVNSVWPAIRQAAIDSDPALEAVLPETLSQQIAGQFAVLDPNTGEHQPIGPLSVTDVENLRERRTTAFEVGYKGLIADRLSVRADVYYTRIHDFIGSLMIETPHVFIDSSAFVETLTGDIVDNSGGAIDTASAEAVAISMYDEFGPLPIGLASPEQLQNATDVVMTYRNFGEVDLAGADVALTYHASEHFNVSGYYSFISKNYFHNLDNIADLSANAPRHKFGGCLEYLSAGLGFSGRLNFRYVDGFPVNSGVYVGEVDRYAIFDLCLTYDPFVRSRLSLTVQNLFDNRHAEFVGAPELGRLAILRVLYRL
ncbi:MAG: TonB-dependent receptor [Candidatus Zixiibacteriota bacterium]|nr:MAG: TonB-dependent receptor [candidate division Zixibacteria bacterium]